MDAGALQQALVESGEAIDAGELAAAQLGPTTALAIRDFQAHHVGPDGHALAIDGIVGPATLWALDHPGASGKSYTVPGWRFTPSLIRAEVRRVLEIAVGELGVCEQPDGSNRGPRVDVYTTPDCGIPWCAAFASWCYAHGADDGSPFGRFTGSWQFREWGIAKGRILGPAAMPSAGDVAVILRADPAIVREPPGHTMMVVGLTDDGRIMTVEGNSGNAVRGLIRPRTSITCFVRPIPLI